MTQPPIPIRAVGRPTVGDLVIPIITPCHTSGVPAFGRVIESVRDAAVRGCVCQLCGQPHGDRIVVFARPMDLHRGSVTDPGLHPECAAYATRACPMLAGRRDKHRAAITNPHRCGDPACVCRFWVSVNPDQAAARASAPADVYLQVWISADQYHVIVADDMSAITIPAQPLAMRPIPTSLMADVKRLLTSGPDETPHDDQ